jgi:hypothetical protein
MSASVGGGRRLAARSASGACKRPRILRWMHIDRGAVETTLTSYGSYVGDLVHFLGDDPRTYRALGLRDLVEQRVDTIDATPPE